MGSGGSHTVERIIEYRERPYEIKEKEEQINLKNKDEIQQMYMTDAKYFEERQKFLSDLFQKYDKQNYLQKNKMKKKIALILFGESQTGKSSLINHLAQGYACTVNNIGQGISCTTTANCYGPFTARTGHEVLLIDTRGFNDFDPKVNNQEVGSTLVQQLIACFIQQISQFNPDSINFLVTESVEAELLQFRRNLHQIFNLFGKNAIMCSGIVLTKYNEHRFQNDDMLQERTEQRLESFDKELKSACQEHQFQAIPYTKFHTHVYDPKTRQIRQNYSNMNQQYLLQQEQMAFQMLNNLPSYPIQIIQEYDLFCKKRIEELQLTDGVGIKKYKTKEIVFK